MTLGIAAGVTSHMRTLRKWLTMRIANMEEGKEMTESDEEVYSCECPKCGHRWNIPMVEWMQFSLATKGKTPRCPKCQSGRILWKIGKP